MRAALPLLALVLAPVASADVRVVSPTGPYTQIQDAVNAANDGDLVLVKPGTYLGFHVQAKSLAIVADALPWTAQVQGTVIVSDLVAGQTATFTGLFAEGTLAGTEGLHYGFSASNNQGSVRCQSCTFAGLYNLNYGEDGFDAARIVGSADVSLVACTMVGGSCWEGLTTYPVGGFGARCVGSTATILECTIYGGPSSPAGWGVTAGAGGAGLVASNSTIFVSKTYVEGGEGGDGYQPAGPAPAPGGPGVSSSSNSTVRVLDCALTGGFNGDNNDSEHLAGTAPAYIGTGYDFLSGSARTQTVAPNPLRELHSVSLSFHGAPGEQVYLLVGLETTVQWDPLRLANFMIAPPQYRTLYLGTTNAIGDLGISLPFGDLGGTTQSRTYFLQPLFSGAGGAQQLGSPVTLAVLDQAF